METSAKNPRETKIGFHLDSYNNPNEGGCHVYVRVRIRSGSSPYAFIPTAVFVKPKYWDKEKKEIRGVKGSYDAQAENGKLEKKRLEIRGIISELEKMGEPITEQTLKRRLAGGEKKKLVDFCRWRLEQERAILAKSTYERYGMEIGIVEGYDQDINLNEISAGWLEDYQTWLLSDGRRRKSTKGPGLTGNSVVGHFSYLKKILHWARKRKFISHDPFEEFDGIVKYRQTERSFLAPAELEKLRAVFLNEELRGIKYKSAQVMVYAGDKLHHVLQYFLFSVYTGLRYSDCAKMDATKIHGDHISLTMKKTQEPLRIKITERVRETVNVEGGPMFEAKIGTNVVMNRHLKIISQIIGLRKKVTFHAARHTFATEMLRRTGNLKLTSLMMGHSSASITEIYTHLSGFDKDKGYDAWDIDIATQETNPAQAILNLLQKNPGLALPEETLEILRKEIAGTKMRKVV